VDMTAAERNLSEDSLSYESDTQAHEEHVRVSKPLACSGLFADFCLVNVGIRVRSLRLRRVSKSIEDLKQRLLYTDARHRYLFANGRPQLFHQLVQLFITPRANFCFEFNSSNFLGHIPFSHFLIYVTSLT
jgi:hypothetical protein